MRIHLTKMLALAALSLVLAGCAAGPDVRTDYEREADFSAYETFGWVPELGRVVQFHYDYSTLRDHGGWGE